MRFLIVADIEGVSGVTTYEQAEKGEAAKALLMSDLNACIEGIRADGPHDVIVYDMHTDGRNIDMDQLPADVSVIMGKPINPDQYKGVDGRFDGLFMVGLHAMAGEPGALLAHTYLRDYKAVYVNDLRIGEIGMEALLAGEQGMPLVFVSGDDCGCREAEALVPGVVTVQTKRSLGEFEAICYATKHTRQAIMEGARLAASMAGGIDPLRMKPPYEIVIQIGDCPYLDRLRAHDFGVESRNTVRLRGGNLLRCWSDYLRIEREVLG